MNFLPANDSELISKVRSVTNYEDTEDQLPESEAQDHTDLTKMELYSEYDIEEFYSDSGTIQALLYGTAISAKIAVENYSVNEWSILGEQFSYDDIPEDESSQLQRWYKLYQRGIDNAELPNGQSSYVKPQLSSNYNF